jgi:threonine/homoserine/homoserine lactone efflux protein
MPPETFTALIALAVGTLFTPGPNNAMLAASGATFGFRRSIPHLLGVGIGFSAMLLIVGLALGQLFQTSVLLREGLRWGGIALLLWLAWKVATSTKTGATAGVARPMSFAGAAGFQWINPKAWPMAIAATAQFIHPGDPVATALIVTATFMALGLLSSATWVLAGQAIARFLTSDRRLRVFNVTMALLIVLSVVELLRH